MSLRQNFRLSCVQIIVPLRVSGFARVPVFVIRQICTGHTCHNASASVGRVQPAVAISLRYLTPWGEIRPTRLCFLSHSCLGLSITMCPFKVCVIRVISIKRANPPPNRLAISECRLAQESTCASREKGKGVFQGLTGAICPDGSQVSYFCLRPKSRYFYRGNSRTHLRLASER